MNPRNILDVHSHPFEGHVGQLVVDVGDAVVVAEVLRRPQRDVEHPLRVLKVAFLGSYSTPGSPP